MILTEYNPVDRKIIQFLQGDIPLNSHPYKELADSLQMSEEEVVKRIIDLKEKGVIRRCGAVLRHHKAGYQSNAMVAWRIEEERQDEVGRLFSALKAVSHCYLRKVDQRFPYNLFTMVHAVKDEELTYLIKKMAALAKSQDYLVLKTLKEFKKTSMVYL